MSGPDDAHPAADETLVTVSAKTYSVEAVKKAAYRMLDRAVITITLAGDDLNCAIRFNQPQSDDEAKRIADDFLAEVIDQDLRGIVAAETAHIRNAILAYAFSRTGLQDDG